MDRDLLDRMRSMFSQLDPGERHVDLLVDEVMLPGATLVAEPGLPLRAGERTTYREPGVHGVVTGPWSSFWVGWR